MLADALRLAELAAAVVDAAAAAAYDRGIRVVVNNGPWLPLAAATLEAADPLVVNEHEAAEACEGRVSTEVVDEAYRVSLQVDRRLALSGGATVVALAGATGSGLTGSASTAAVPGVEVEPGAGRGAPEAEVELEARLFVAAMDGMELQWLLDPRVDLLELFDRFLETTLARWTR